GLVLPTRRLSACRCVIGGRLDSTLAQELGWVSQPPAAPDAALSTAGGCRGRFCFRGGLPGGERSQHGSEERARGGDAGQSDGVRDGPLYARWVGTELSVKSVLRAPATRARDRDQGRGFQR